ncbi:MAG: hypothetical protein LBC82_05910 [Oscillospiraceae bacterium]|jgi:hypothetical protein|nr:hypothetical protein [Oscillospiraceae bacterium]
MQKSIFETLYRSIINPESKELNKIILKQLFESNSEQLKITDPQYDEISDTLSEIKESFANSLSESDLEIFENIEDLNCKINYIYDLAYFSEGFKIAVALMAETLYHKKKIS